MPLPYETIKQLIHKAIEPYVGEKYTDGLRIGVNLAVQHVLTRIQADDTHYAIELTAADASQFGEIPSYVPACATALFNFEGCAPHPVFPDRIKIRFSQKTPWKWFEVDFEF